MHKKLQTKMRQSNINSEEPFHIFLKWGTGQNVYRPDV